MIFKQFIINSLKPYIDKEISVTVTERIWDSYLKSWVDKDMIYTGIYKGMVFPKGYDETLEIEYDIMKMKLLNKEGKTRTIKIDMNNTKIEFPKL